MKIAIIGGSIAGCALALLLKDAFDVTVFERSKELKSRGAGLTMPKELLQQLIAKGMIDQDIVTYPSSSRSFYCQHPSKPDYGHCIWHQDMSIVGVHWDTLFNNLRKRVPETLYKNGSFIIDVQINDNCTSQVTLESGETQDFDMVIFADGYHSLGRSIISVNSHLEYSGYVAWRGLIDFDLIKDKAPFINNIPYYCFNNGHLLAYPVHHDDTKKLNWVLYEQLEEEDLERLGNTTQLEFSELATKHLHQLALAKLPKAMAQLIIDTKAPFMQKIVDVSVERLVHKNSLLVGDASIVLRPHVGNGASLALQDALCLSEQLKTHEDFQQALAQWEKHTLPNRLSTYALSKRMANALVLNPVMWQGMDELKMKSWWEQIILGDKWYTTPPQNTANIK